MTNNKSVSNLSLNFPDFMTTYDKEMIERLRKFKYISPLPLSIALLAHPMCVSYCHIRSVQLSQAMPKFKLIKGDINLLSCYDSPNHSWVEDDKYVYDTTDNCKWDKEVYYALYEPKAISILTEKDCMMDEFYSSVINHNTDKVGDLDAIELMLEALELLEKEKPTINHDLLLNEIALFRNKYGLKPKYYKKYVKSMSKKFFPDYYLSLNQNK